MCVFLKFLILLSGTNSTDAGISGALRGHCPPALWKGDNGGGGALT